jgi:lipopolysaccharide/colanic/teichoic acid biosynthesis glycosyltransferase
MFNTHLSQSIASDRVALRAAAWVSRILLSGPVSLFCAILLAVGLPVTVGLADPIEALKGDAIRGGAVGAVAAVVLSAFVISHIAQFPGIHDEIYIAPTFTAIYGLVLAFFLFTRLDYSRPLLLLSFLVAVLFYLAASHIRRHMRRLCLALVPGGGALTVARQASVDCVALEEPKLPTAAVDALVVDLGHDFSPRWERFIADCAVSGVPVYHFKQVCEWLTGRVEIEHLSENNLGSLVPNFAYIQVKSVLDRVLALVLLIAFAPLMGLIALLIRLDSPGPALFFQDRMGFHGRPIRVVKFRSMRHVAGGGADRGSAITRLNDDRITRLGHLLRRTRLDELPQLVNVLLGEMSFIGPRPEALQLSTWYEQEIPYYRYRHIVKPGISGWAQVNQGHVADVHAVRAKLQYDFFYIRHFSPWLDLLILMRTVTIMFTGFGAR